MAIVPKRKTSKMRKRIRNSHSALKPQNLTQCTNCGETIKQHMACKHCGFYKGKQVTEARKK